MDEHLNPGPEGGPHAQLTPAHQAEHQANMDAFPIGAQVCLAARFAPDRIEVDHSDNTRPALYRVADITPVRRVEVTGGTALVGPFWTLRSLGPGNDRDRVPGSRLRPLPADHGVTMDGVTGK